MLNTLFIYMIIVLSFCLVGSSLLGGKLRGVCFDNDTGQKATRTCTCQRFFTMKQVSSLDGFSCLDVPPRGVTSAPYYESIGHSAIVSMSQIVSLDSWAVAMSNIMGVEGYIAEVVYFLMVIILPTYCSKLFIAQTIHSYQIVMGMDLTRRAQTMPVIKRIQNPLLSRAFAGLRHEVQAIVARKEEEMMAR